MVSKACVFIFICVGLFVVIQTLFPKALALRSTGIEEYMVEDKRTRQDYVVQRALDDEYSDADYGPKYTVDAPRPGADRLPDFIIDYANMIRKNVILLDNSVETRTRKTGNIKVKKENHAFSEVPCKCENRSEPIDLTKEWGIVYPYMVHNITCNDMCVKPYKCEGKIYNITILKKRPETLTISKNDLNELNSHYHMPLPSGSADLVRRWAPKTIPITIACHCILK